MTDVCKFQQPTKFASDAVDLPIPTGYDHAREVAECEQHVFDELRHRWMRTKTEWPMCPLHGAVKLFRFTMRRPIVKGSRKSEVELHFGCVPYKAADALVVFHDHPTGVFTDGPTGIQFRQEFQQEPNLMTPPKFDRYEIMIHRKTGRHYQIIEVEQYAGEEVNYRIREVGSVLQGIKVLQSEIVRMFHFNT